jgi:predicted lipoprotein with Yx(FWY)xxD motif
MIKRFGVLAFACAVALAACGGGGSSGSGGGGGVPAGPTPTPVPGNLPLSEAVGTSPAWVNPSSHRTLYFLSVDTATTQMCTAAAGGCTGVWPVFTPIAGSVNTDNMTIISRSDGSGQQWTYTGHPLYTYSGDTAPDQANGEGIPDFGGTWHVARPSGSATPPPGDPGCKGYC